MAVRFSDRDFLADLTQALNTEIERQRDGLEKGVEHPDYMKIVGTIAGLRLALVRAGEVKRRNDKEDD